jgi:AraC-like DNA-binding protein
MPESSVHPRVHLAEHHPSSIAGLEPVTLISNHHFPRHSHDQFGFGVIYSGAHRSWSGRGVVNASAGDVIMCNPGEMHDGLPVKNQPRRWRIIYLDPALVARELREETSRLLEFLRPVARDPLLARRFARLFTSLTSTPSDPLATEEHLLSALIHLLRRHAVTYPLTAGPTPPIANALKRLNSAPETPVSLAELAALSGVSRFQLLRGFTREVGTTPHAYLVQRRVCLARRLLAKGQTPAEAALQSGFADQSHMTRAFVRHLAITPGRYRAAVTYFR